MITLLAPAIFNFLTDEPLEALEIIESFLLISLAVKTTNKARLNYSVYFKDGSLLETSVEEVANFNGVFSMQRKNSGGYQPILAGVGQNDRMIGGFKEGVRLLKEGDRATLFLPYNIAYGENGVQGIPPMSDLIFEVEINSLED